MTANEFIRLNSHTPNEEMLIKFAQMHVQNALKEASKLKTYGMLVIPLFNEEQQASILNAYSLENIK